MPNDNIAIAKTQHQVRFPNESAEYRRARNALLEAEIALRSQIEATAQLRRSLPLGGKIAHPHRLQPYVRAKDGSSLPKLYVHPRWP